MMSVLIPALAFAGVVAVVGLVGVAMKNRGTKATNRRLDAFTTGKGAEGQHSQANVEIWKDAAFDEDKKNLLDQLMPKWTSLDKIFEQAEVNVKPSTLLAVSIVLALLGLTSGWLMHLPWFIWPIPAVFLFFLPWAWLFFKRKQRLKRFASQLPDALELLARALRAGQSLPAGMHVVSEEMPPPVSLEFGRVYEEQNLGISLEDSLFNMCERVPNLDLRFFVTSVNIQRQTGGDLAEILDKIGYVIRERFRILGQVKALTGEGRLSGVVLLALPPALFLVVLNLNPGYLELLWTTDLGIKMTIGALVLQILGALAIRKIVDIKV